MMTNIQTFSAPLGRFFISIIFVMAGLNKISGYEGAAGYIDTMGVLSGLLPLVVVLEVIGGLAIITGWKTRPVAIVLAGLSILSALIFHADFTDQNMMIMFMRNIAIVGGLLFLVTHGPSACALGNLTINKRKASSVAE
jgi:putative oxidoreductase